LNKDNGAAVAEFVIDEFKDGGGEDARDVRRVRFKLADKRASLESLAKLCGYITERREVRLRNLAELSDEEIAALLGDDEAQGEAPRA